MAKLKRSPGALLRDFGQRRLGTYAAAGTFYLFLSLPSIVLIAVSLPPYTELPQEMAERVLGELFPNVVNSVLQGIVDSVYNASGARLSLSILLTVWTASLCMAALMRGLRVSYDAKLYENYIVLRIKAFFYMALLFAITFLSFGGIVFGRRLFYLAVERFGLSEGLQRFGSALKYWRYAILFVFMTWSFTLIYRFCSGTRITLRHHIPGALITAALWLIFSWAFSLYVNSPNSYSVYGILGTLILAMLWAYYCLFILLVGGYLNRILAVGQ